MKFLCKVAFASVLFLPLCGNEDAVMAETTNDLKALYDSETKKGLQELQDKYEEAVRALEDTAAELQLESDIVKRQEKFNEFLAEAEAASNEEKRLLDEEIWDLMWQNVSISKEISDIFFGDFGELVALDARYKKNREMVEVLLDKKNGLQLVSGYSISYDSVNDLEDEVTKLYQEASQWQEAYEESMAVSELGEVTVIKFPLGEDSEIRSPYGERIDPINPGTIRFHAGADLKAAMRTSVLAIFNGTVASVGWGPLGGYYVWIDHGDGVRSYYCHLDEISCKVGQPVSQYEQIAYSGNTGSRTTGPHLHFGLYIDGVSVDPAILFRGVRLGED